jgi:opacity protein-like surface antigen
MRKIPVIVLVVLGLAFAGMAEAAKPKKRTRNANRVGPYGTVLVGMSGYGGDQSNDEQSLLDLFSNAGVPVQNAVASTDDSDIGYQASFGYRFNRYIAFELGLAQFGSLESTGHADVDLPNDGQGFVPANLEYSFNVGGPMISAVGMLPLGEKFEVYARLGFLFASVEREFTSRVGGERGVGGSAKGDAQEPVYGVGLTWNINQVYSVRGEYQLLSDVGDASRTGTEDLKTFAIGMIIRF